MFRCKVCNCHGSVVDSLLFTLTKILNLAVLICARIAKSSTREARWKYVTHQYRVLHNPWVVHSIGFVCKRCQSTPIDLLTQDYLMNQVSILPDKEDPHRFKVYDPSLRRQSNIMDIRFITERTEALVKDGVEDP